MAKVLVTMYVTDYWKFSQVLPMEVIPRAGEYLVADDHECYTEVSEICHNLETGITEVYCYCNVADAAGWFMSIPGWKIDDREAFLKDEAEIRKTIQENYEEDTFVPEFKEE